MDGTPEALISGRPQQADRRLRHAVVGLSALALGYLFWASRSEWSAMHAVNRALADVSLVLLSISMAVGPLARIWARATRLLPWRRQTGIWTIIYGAAHTIVILEGWVEWDLVRLFGFLRHPQTGQYVMVLHGFGLGNVLGIVALLYGAVLAVTSNDASQRFLGAPAWKFLQQASYTVWMLVLAHTGYFLFLHFLDFHRSTPEPNWLQLPFATLIAGVAALQSWAFLLTWRRRAQSEPS